jgi:DNA-binding transcriptional MerR regulator
MPIKISELERITGVPQSTIRYYVKEGILPQPTKVNKSMAYYDESCVERIALVRELQEKKYYPLSVIKNIISRMDNGISLPSLLSLEDAIFRPRGEGEQRLLSRSEFLDATGIDKGLLDTAEQLNIIIPYNKGGDKPYDQEDVIFAKGIIRGTKDLGIDVREISFYVEYGKKIVEEELRLRKKIVAGKNKDENIAITLTLSEHADELRSYILRRLFQSKVKEMIEKSKDKDKKSLAVTTRGGSR